MTRSISVLTMLTLAACESAAVGPADGGPVSCDVDRACPDSAPVWGGPCEGTLSCTFQSQCGPGSDDVYECVSGEWSLTMPAPCAGGQPPLAERCRDPFTGTLEDASVWISADRAGAPPIADGDVMEVAFGAQGLAMIPLRVHVDADAPPPCAQVTITLGLDDMTSAPASHPVRLRCGGSLRIQELLPDLPCEMREYAVSIDVEVDGAGAIHRDVTVMGGMCPRG